MYPEYLKYKIAKLCYCKQAEMTQFQWVEYAAHCNRETNEVLEKYKDRKFCILKCKDLKQYIVLCEQEDIDFFTKYKVISKSCDIHTALKYVYPIDIKIVCGIQ